MNVIHEQTYNQNKMISLVNLSSRILIKNSIKNIILCKYRPSVVRLISTSDKKKENTVSYYPGLMEKQPKGPETPKDFADVESQKNWISFGFDFGNMEEDRFLTKVSFFIFITIMLVTSTYIFTYLPDYKLQHWAKREAFLELERRHKLGLPYVNKDYVDPKQIDLPSEEELAQTDVDVHI